MLAGSASNAFNRDLKYAEQFVRKHYRKLLFGTDRFVNREAPVMIDMLKNMNLPSEMAEAIFTKNAEMMLELS